MKISDQKENLRNSVQQVSEQLRALTAVAIENKINKWPVFQNARSVAFYLAMNDEIPLSWLFDSSKEKFLPRFENKIQKYEMAVVGSPKELAQGRYGILEPPQSARSAIAGEIDLWLIPGVLFSRKGGRLGRGGGFYDRLLENTSGVKAGITFPDRVIEDIPVDNQDVKMDFLITEKEIINTKG